MKISCISIDDEPIALDVIEDHISKIPFLDFKGRFQNPFDAIEFLDTNKVDLIFLDIQMPELTGFEFLKALPKQPFIVFTTAYPDFALDSYEIEAIDYLVKPIPFERFLKGVSKVKSRMLSITDQQDNVKAQSCTDANDFIFVKTDYKTVKLFLDDILFIESMKDYVAFQLKEERVLSLLSIKSVEAKLPETNFIRVHRSFIINVSKIELIERNIITVNNSQIPIGESYREIFKSVIENKRLG